MKKKHFTLFTLLAFSLFLFSCADTSREQNQTQSPVIQPQPSQTAFQLGSCIDARQPTPEPNETSLFRQIDANDHVIGTQNARVTILVYSDFQCVSCAQLAKLLNEFAKKYPTEISIVFRHFPLVVIHDKAALAAQAAEAANLQGKFWEMHDFLFQNQTEWLELSPDDFTSWIISHSATIGVDEIQLASDITSPAVVEMVMKTWDEGQAIKLPGTPVILINGDIIKWQVNLLDQLETYVKLSILSQKQLDSCPQVVIDLQKQYTATLTTSRGDVKIRLFPQKAPNTVNNFIFLVNQGWYNNVPFHLVIPGVMVQTGDPSGTGLGNPGYFFPTEKNSVKFDRSGFVAMANMGPNSNGSQFFITLSSAPNFNNQYPIFGEVIDGMDILLNLTPNDPSIPLISAQPDMLISISIDEK
jgi:cyclophilin family peptidyl-prolyl cis-trans isomerase/protein-disulfide isomerase